MLWFFEKQNSKLRYEIRRESDGPDFELVITHPDGREEIEKFSDPVAVLQRSEHLQNDLTAAGWQSPATAPRSRPRL
jgi:hypothetical protein